MKATSSDSQPVESPAANGQDQSNEVGIAPSESPPRLPLRIQALLEETLFPNPGGVELLRDPMHDYLHRFTQRSPHVAELFLENSKIVPASRTNQALDESLVEATRQWYFSTAYRPHEGAFDPIASEEARVSVPLTSFSVTVSEFLRSLSADESAWPLLYAIDVMLVTDAEVFRVVPGSDLAWMVRRLRRRERESISRAIAGPRRGTVDPEANLLVFVGVPWRYMIFQGPRGCRRMLIDLGRLLSRCEETARANDLRRPTELDFVDPVIEQALLLDGVERSALAIMVLQQ